MISLSDVVRIFKKDLLFFLVFTWLLEIVVTLVLISVLRPDLIPGSVVIPSWIEW